jgi:hypothetical protein
MLVQSAAAQSLAVKGRIAMANDKNAPVPEKGEGNHSADRRYRDETRRFIDSGRVDEAAQEAKRALDEDRDALEAAEAEGKSHIAEEDPQISRRS